MKLKKNFLYLILTILLFSSLTYADSITLNDVIINLTVTNYNYNISSSQNLIVESILVNSTTLQINTSYSYAKIEKTNSGAGVIEFINLRTPYNDIRYADGSINASPYQVFSNYNITVTVPSKGYIEIGDFYADADVQLPSNKSCGGLSEMLQSAIALLIPMAIIFVVLIIIGFFKLMDSNGRDFTSDVIEAGAFKYGAMAIVILVLLLVVGMVIITNLPCPS